MKNVISAVEARKNFYEIVRQAAKPGNRVTIVHPREKTVVLVPKSDVDNLRKKIGILVE